MNETMQSTVLFQKTFLTDFEKCEWCAAFLDSCASDKRTNQIQNKLIKNYYKIQTIYKCGER